jgi:magnesium-transporting ATPase (P-type)
MSSCWSDWWPSTGDIPICGIQISLTFRLAKLVVFSFYKNLTMILVQFWFGFFSCFSSTPSFDGWFLTFYNLLFTSLGPISLAIFEKDVAEEALLKVTRSD